MGIEKALLIGERGAKAAGKGAEAFVKSGWGKAALALTGSGLIFSNYVYPKYQEERTAAQEKDVRAEGQRAATESQSATVREYLLERERSTPGGLLQAGKTPSGQFNLSGIAVLVVLVIIAFVVIKVVKK